MSASRRHYDEEFKRRAVKLSYSSERTLTEISESLGISAGLLGKWRRKYTPSGEKTELSQEQEENRRLRQRISELEEENYILKKATAYFAKEQK